MNQDKGGFEQFIEAIKNEARQYVHRPKKLVEILFTQGGKIPYEVGEQSLNHFQKAVYLNLENQTEDVVFWDNDGPTDSIHQSDTFRIYFGLTRYGRLILSRYNKKNTYHHIFGYIHVTHQFIENVHTLYCFFKQKERELYFKEVVPFFQDNQNNKNNLIAYIKFHIYHMAPILLYINDCTYNTFYNYNNLVEELGGDTDCFLLKTLTRKNVDKWTKEEKCFVFNMYILLKSGPPARGEEVNGIHFSLSFLEEYLQSKIESYSKKLHHTRINHDMTTASFYEQAHYIARLRKEVEKDYIIYREINGLNLHKTENFILKKEFRYFDKVLYETIGKYSEYSATKDYYDVFYTMLKRHIHQGPEKIIQKMYEMILRRAVEVTHSDIAMTRGFRAPLRFVEANQQDHLEEIFNWKQKEYFCCVVPSERMREAFKEQQQLLFGILTAISKRMQYNSWHYTPGNFLEHQERFTRHFYFPPVMADITEWSDQHHRGHVFACIKHAIRCPGSIQFHNKQYHAFFDLRLMRRTGNKYSQQDLLMALHYKDVLKALDQAWLDICFREHLDIHIDVYNREWYKQMYVK